MLGSRKKGGAPKATRARSPRKAAPKRAPRRTSAGRAPQRKAKAPALLATADPTDPASFASFRGGAFAPSRRARVLAAAGQVSHTPRGVPPGHRAHGVCAAVPRAAHDGHAAPPGRRAARWAGAPPESTPAADSLPCPAPPPPRASGTHLAQPLGYTPTPLRPRPRRDL